MPSLLPGYEYDVFISYRQNDNRSGWVSQFVEDLREEVAATIKEPVNIYFDENPHDGLQETHHVSKTLEGKLKCLIFLPVLSHTYCDPKSFAWTNEFLAFCQMAEKDSLGLEVRLWNGNVASRVLPVQIHDLDARDMAMYAEATGSPVRSVDFIFRSPGVNRPLTPSDVRAENLSKTIYRDQINKTANAIEELIRSVTATTPSGPALHTKKDVPPVSDNVVENFWHELQRRNVLRAAIAYIIVALLLIQTLAAITPWLELEESTLRTFTALVVVAFFPALWMAWMFEASPQGLIRTTSEQSGRNPYTAAQKKPLTSKTMIYVLVGSLVLITVYIIIEVLPPRPPKGEPIALVVLPFEVRGNNTEDKHLADGITDDIINRLTSTGQVVVRTRSSMQPLITKAFIYPDLAKELEASFIVRGSIERAGNMIKVTVQLLNEDGTYLWGDTFSHKMEDLFTAQSEIAAKIVAWLRIELKDHEVVELVASPTTSLSAFEAYSRGLSNYLQYSDADNDTAILEFRKAIQLDPRYARAWAGLADAFAQRHGRFGREFFWTDSAMLASRRAIQLDSTLAEGYKAQALVFAYRKNFDSAIYLLLKAVKINRTYVTAVGNLGSNYLSKRELAEALKWKLLSAAFDPSNWIPYQQIGWTYRLLGDLEQAELWLRRSLEKRDGSKQFDTFEHLAYTYIAMGRRDDARRLSDEVLKRGGQNSRSFEAAGLIAHFVGDTAAAKRYYLESIQSNAYYKDDANTYSPIGLGQILLEQGNKVDAEVYLQHAMFTLTSEWERGAQSVDLPYYIAAVHAIRGNRDKSLEWLQKAVDRKWNDYAMIEFGPYFKRYRTEKAFIDIMESLKSKTNKMRTEAAANR